ncbi:MAG: hypothetical protein JSS76_02130 [Bacteroidetes bacterium]|nr:hypothetical protein [Bacteroidota bacterium]MBS1683521.1 hypothetical protein [Bacteroidota bacterium]
MNWTLPDAYNPFDICFTVISEDDISDDNTFSNISFNDADTIRTNTINNHYVPSAINIYFIADADQGGVQGRSVRKIWTNRELESKAYKEDIYLGISLADGIYFLKLNSSNYSKSIRIVKSSY